MIHEKVQLRICTNDGCNNQCAKGRTCENCKYKESMAKRTKWAKKSKSSLQKKINKTDEARILYDKLLVLWSEKVRGNSEYTNCLTCPAIIKTRDGLNGAHAGHYIDKGNHWKLALNPLNGLTQCIKCNVYDWQNPRIAETLKIKMRAAMVKLHGEAKVLHLENQAEEFRNRVNLGEENIKPRTHDPLHFHFNRDSDLEFLKKQHKLLLKL